MESQIECPLCGGTASLVREPRAVLNAPPGTTAQDELYRCDGCREGFYLPGMMDASLRAAAAARLAALEQAGG